MTSSQSFLALIPSVASCFLTSHFPLSDNSPQSGLRYLSKRQIRPFPTPSSIQAVKNLPAMWETRVQSLGREDPLEKGMATHSSILAWRIPWTEEPGGLQSIGLQSWTQLSDQHFHSWWNRTFSCYKFSSHLLPCTLLVCQDSGYPWSCSLFQDFTRLKSECQLGNMASSETQSHDTFTGWW